MSEHYYTKHPKSEMVTETQEVILNQHHLTFTTASGVFSKSGIDFGTKVLIEAFEAPEIAGALLDLGCGYGPVGITLAKTYPKRNIIMVDINERALELARKNALDNSVQQTEIINSSGFDALKNRAFAAIITNPPIRAGKRVIYPMLERAYDHLHSDGELWVVIQKKQGAPSLIKFLNGIFQEVKEVNREKGYSIIRAVKCDDV